MLKSSVTIQRLPMFAVIDVADTPTSNFDIIAEARFDTSNNDVFSDGVTTIDQGEGGSTTVPAFKDSGGNFAVKAIYKF